MSSINTTLTAAENEQTITESSQQLSSVLIGSNDTTSGQKNDVPITSSLDTHDIFFTILEYPPTKPPTCLVSDIPSSNNCSFIYEERNDPISASLARQSIEERSGYYKSPTRTPVPYYHYQKQSSVNSSKTNHLIMIDDLDEDEKAMQRWSASSYHVW
ncbi:hypothetical protein INT47_002461 [Mucor saturninus]|uniref:Uncharacterized protein n=1 Tax=Mucor saturninus TaxID=64648 RepID=A0A8H7VDI5_9FUNG|nr:hypothetical protein INT47_002461 [Mucor saturninus]